MFVKGQGEGGGSTIIGRSCTRPSATSVKPVEVFSASLGHKTFRRVGHHIVSPRGARRYYRSIPHPSTGMPNERTNERTNTLRSSLKTTPHREYAGRPSLLLSTNNNKNIFQLAMQQNRLGKVCVLPFLGRSHARERQRPKHGLFHPRKFPSIHGIIAEPA